MSKTKSKEIPLRWRTDFRIPDALPDIKVVRTSFLVNFVAISLAMASLFYLAQRQYTVGTLRSSVAAQEESIAGSTASNRENVALNRQFVAAGRQVEELQQFFKTPVVLHNFLAELAFVRPEGIVFSQLSIRPSSARGGNEDGRITVEIRGDVRELAVLDQLKTVIDGFVFADPTFQAVVTENVQPRTPEGTFPYSLDIVIRPRS